MSEMPEPTIDEMLAFLESLDYDDVPTMNAIRAILEQWQELQTLLATCGAAVESGQEFNLTPEVRAEVRALAALERSMKLGRTREIQSAQHKLLEDHYYHPDREKQANLAAIRMFVERVEDRSRQMAIGANKRNLIQYRDAVLHELSAMQREANVD